MIPKAIFLQFEVRPKPEAMAISPTKSSSSWDPDGRAIGAMIPGD